MKNKKQQILFPTRATWEKLLGRWSDFPDCGEKKLVCAVIAGAIADANRNGHFESQFFGSGLDNYCKAIDLSPQFVREQILMVASRVGELVEVQS